MTLLAVPVTPVHFWRDKQQREIDFVLPRGRDSVDAIECKWSADAFDPHGLAAFREAYPKGRNFLVCPIPTSYRRLYGDLTVTVTPLIGLGAALGGKH